MASVDFITKLHQKLNDAGIECSKTVTGKMMTIVTDAMFEEAVGNPDGIRLPNGNGSFRLKKLSASQKRSPRTGAVVNVPERHTLRYHPGKSVKDLLSKVPV